MPVSNPPPGADEPPGLAPEASRPLDAALDPVPHPGLDPVVDPALLAAADPHDDHPIGDESVQDEADEVGEAGPVAPPLPAPPAVSRAAGLDERHVRCFLAVNFPLVAVRRMADEIAALRGPVAAAGLAVRWVPAANLHLTLKFLGPVRREAVEAITAALPAALRGLRTFELEARGLGAFPSNEAPRVLWIGVRAGEEPGLVALQQAVEQALAGLGFPLEERPYRPHITIGRVRPPGPGAAAPAAGSAGVGGVFAERGSRGYGVARVGEVVVYDSRTLERGSEYHALARVPLGR